MKRLLLCAALAGVIGCSDLQQMADEAKRDDAAEPPGIAPAEMVGNPLNPNGARPAAPANQNPLGAGAPARQKTSIVGKTTTKVVDYRKAIAENPKLVEARNEVRGGDAFLNPAKAYIAASSRISAENFKHQLNIMRELNGGQYPTFEQYQQTARELRIEFAQLPAYQMYAYDDQTGRVIILEDPAEKARLREAAGLPPQ